MPAVVDSTDDVVFGAARIIEEDFAELSRAVGLRDATHFDAGLTHRHQEIRDALVLRGSSVGSSKEEAVVGVVAASGPHLLAVDHPLVTIEHGARLQAGEVAAAIGLTETLTPAHLAREDLRQELFLLFFGAPLQQRRADERVAEEVAAHRRTSTREFFGEHDTFKSGEPFAAVLLRPSCTDPTSGEQLARPLVIESLALVIRHLETLVEPTFRQVGF